MSYFKAKLHQIQFRICPRPSWGSLQRSPLGDYPRPPCCDALLI